LVTVQARGYLESFKGNDDTGENSPLHGLLYRILEGGKDSDEGLKHALRALQYRLTQTSMADEYLSIMDIPPLKSSSCYEYDVRSVCKEVDETEFSTIAQLIRDRTVLFPMPVHDQGRAFSKPRDYIIAAFHHAKVSKDDVVQKLNQLTAILNEDVERTKEALNQYPEIRSKRERLFHAFGERLKPVSPAERPSRGPLLTE